MNSFLIVEMVDATIPSNFMSSKVSTSSCSPSWTSSCTLSEFLHLKLLLMSDSSCYKSTVQHAIHVAIFGCHCCSILTWLTVWRRWDSASPPVSTSRARCSVSWSPDWCRGPSRGLRKARGYWDHWRVLCWSISPSRTYNVVPAVTKNSFKSSELPEYDGDKAAVSPESSPSQVAVTKNGTHWRLEKVDFKVVDVYRQQSTYGSRHGDGQEDSLNISDFISAASLSVLQGWAPYKIEYQTFFSVLYCSHLSTLVSCQTLTWRYKEKCEILIENSPKISVGVELVGEVETGSREGKGKQDHIGKHGTDNPAGTEGLI